MHIPQSYYVYEFSYPEGMPELAGIIFYVGKGTGLHRMNVHLNEAASGCDCAKCNAIRSIWGAGLVVARRIVFESSSETDTLDEGKRRILQHRSPHLTNVQHAGRALETTLIAQRAIGFDIPKEIDQTREYLTTPQAAERSSLSKAYLTILLNRGDLEGFRLGRDWLIYTDSLEKFLATSRKSGPKGPRNKPAQGAQSSISGPTDAIRNEHRENGTAKS
jgi:excisionase family DNA binding protein